MPLCWPTPSFKKSKAFASIKALDSALRPGRHGLLLWLLIWLRPAGSCDDFLVSAQFPPKNIWQGKTVSSIFSIQSSGQQSTLKTLHLYHFAKKTMSFRGCCRRQSWCLQHRGILIQWSYDHAPSKSCSRFIPIGTACCKLKILHRSG